MWIFCVCPSFFPLLGKVAKSAFFPTFIMPPARCIHNIHSIHNELHPLILQGFSKK